MKNYLTILSVLLLISSFVANNGWGKLEKWDDSFEMIVISHNHNNPIYDKATVQIYNDASDNLEGFDVILSDSSESVKEKPLKFKPVSTTRVGCRAEYIGSVKSDDPNIDTSTLVQLTEDCNKTFKWHMILTLEFGRTRHNDLYEDLEKYTLVGPINNLSVFLNKSN